MLYLVLSRGGFQRGRWRRVLCKGAQGKSQRRGELKPLGKPEREGGHSSGDTSENKDKKPRNHIIGKKIGGHSSMMGESSLVRKKVQSAALTLTSRVTFLND